MLAIWPCYGISFQGGRNARMTDADRDAPPRRIDPEWGAPMRYEKAETILRIALDMQGTAEGLSLDDIRQNYSDKPLSRRTAERLRDAIERVFPNVQQANAGELPKRWRLPSATVSGLAAITADELSDLTTAVSVLRRDNMVTQAENTKRVISKLRALLKPPVMARIDPDIEALTEAEGFAMRPGPRPKDQFGCHSCITAGDPFHEKGPNSLSLSQLGQTRLRHGAPLWVPVWQSSLLDRLERERTSAQFPKLLAVKH
jgi:hypothetical protein